MKKLFILAAVTAVTLAVQGVEIRVFPLINGNCVLLATNSTIYWDSTNVLFQTSDGAHMLSLTNDPGLTNRNGPRWSRDIPVFPTTTGEVNSNVGLSVRFGDTNMITTLISNAGYSASGFFVVSNASNPVQVGSATNWYPLFPAGTITNTYTLTFIRSVDGLNYPDARLAGANAPAAIDKFVWAIPFGGLCTNMVFTTNVPSAFLTGAKTIRLGSVLNSPTATTTSQGALLVEVNISQPVP